MVNAIVILGGACGFVALIISLLCVAYTVGLAKSTHNIQYVPLETPKDLDALATKESKDPFETVLQEEADKVGPRKKFARDSRISETQAAPEDDVARAAFAAELEISQSDALY